jgi:hypothetical protein
VEIHSETERDDGALQKCTRDAAAFVDVGMRKAEPKTIPTVSAIGGESNPVNESASARTKIIFGTVGIGRKESISLEARWASKNQLRQREDTVLRKDVGR